MKTDDARKVLERHAELKIEHGSICHAADEQRLFIPIANVAYELATHLREALADVERVVEWSDEMRDRIRDIYLNTEASAMHRDDVAGREIASAEKECRLRHEPILRAARRAKPIEES